MSHWHRQIQTVVDTIDDAIREGGDERLTLDYLASRLGYSPFHTTRMFRALAGLPLRDYLRLRRLAFALIAVRDTDASLLEIAVEHGFSSHEAFTRAFKAAYGVAPAQYRKRPVPVVLRTKINPLDYYLIGKGEIGMAKTNEDIKLYYVQIPAHKYLHIKNYESNGYFDFWEKQDKIPGQDCDTICGLLDSIKGKLDGEDDVVGKYSGQIIGYPREADGRIPEAYGVRLAADYRGTLPGDMLVLDVAEGEYIVFEHGPFDFEAQGGAVFEQLEAAVKAHSFAGSGYAPDDSAGRIAYYYHDPERFIKLVIPVKKA